jgi:hypothetical protein
MPSVVGDVHLTLFCGIMILISLQGLNIDAFSVPTCHGVRSATRLYMMGGGFGSSGPKGTAPPKTNLKNTEHKISASSSGSKSVGKSDGASYIKHCPTMNRSLPNVRCVHDDPPIFEIDNFLSSGECDDFISRAVEEGLVVPSQTFSADSGSKRTSSTWYLPYEAVPELLNNANKLTGLKIPTFEEPQVVRYEIGQQFSWHYDAIPKSLQVALTTAANLFATRHFQNELLSDLFV